jgi:hypothetical protein
MIATRPFVVRSGKLLTLRSCISSQLVLVVVIELEILSHQTSLPSVTMLCGPVARG